MPNCSHYCCGSPNCFNQDGAAMRGADVPTHASVTTASAAANDAKARLATSGSTGATISSAACLN